MSPILSDCLTAFGLFALLVSAFEGGFRYGRRSAAEADQRAGAQVGAVQGAILGLLGLLLAFSFSAAGGRFFEKQDLITQEANAIGTAYLRADQLDDPHRSQLRAALKRYTEQRIGASASLAAGLSQSTLEEVDALHAAIWTAASAGAAAKPAVALLVLPPVNEVLDLHSTRVAAGRKHVPALVMGLLISCSFLAVGAIGYGSGVAGHRRAPMTLSLTILIAAALWITIDLDHPRQGFLQLSDAPLRALKFDH